LLDTCAPFKVALFEFFSVALTLGLSFEMNGLGAW
jgi:hypothetical protein